MGYALIVVGKAEWGRGRIRDSIPEISHHSDAILLEERVCDTFKISNSCEVYVKIELRLILYTVYN